MFRPIVIAVLLVYVGMHVFLFLRLRRAYRPSLPISLVLIACLCLMGFAVVWPRMLDRVGYATAAHICGVLGHTWMVLLFWFTAASILFMVWNLIMRLAGRLWARTRRFLGLRAPLGKFAVTGNHDYYTGLSYSLGYHDTIGFRVLREEWVRVAPGLVVAGVDDSAGTYTDQPCLIDDASVLQTIPPGPFVVLLKHQPLVTRDAVGLFDIQLSGHTHGGQVFPFAWVVRLFYPYGSGMHRLNDRSLLYVSRGTGVWGTPLRVLAKPEITLFVIGPSGS